MIEALPKSFPPDQKVDHPQPFLRDTPRNTLLRIPMPENNRMTDRQIKKIRVHTDRPSQDSNTDPDKIPLAP